jgi:hypothetical protein
MTSRSALGSILLTLTLSTNVAAEELANIFGTEEQQALSREASAEAIRALELALFALRLREVRESSGQAQLLEAAASLFVAVEKMQSLLKLGLADFKFTEEDLAFIASRMGSAGERYEGLFKDPTTFVQFFSDYTRLGEILAISLKQAGEGVEGQSALSVFSVPLTDFIVLGDTITVLSRSRLQ